ncbi:MAG: radical SAM protein [Acidobacteria bacterium]|jgi:hypothetical protein|nr:radical SAM protein [Acidobacteriota bacterium]
MNDHNNKILLALLPSWSPLIPPQGIARIKGFLQEKGYRVKTVDANLETGFKQLYDEYFNRLRGYVPGEKHGNFYNIGNDVWREHMMAHINYVDEREYYELVKILVHRIFYIHINDDQVRGLNEILTDFYTKLEKYILDLLAGEQPAVLGISVYRDTLPASLFAFRLARKKYPHIKNIMGGGIFSIQLTVDSPNLNTFLEKTKDYIDKVVIGEGEIALLKFLKNELPQGKRLITKKDLGGEVIGFAPLEFYDYSDFDNQYYQYMAAQGSASCPNKCSFCNVYSFYGEYRQKDPGKLVEEMTILYKRYNTQLFFMLDALMNGIATGLAREFIESDMCLYWDGYFRVEEKCDMEKVLLWRRGGFYRARIGVESGSQHVLDLMEKGITVQQIKETIINLASAGIKTTVYVVIGHPGETEEDFLKTLAMLEELKDNIWEAECNPFTYFYSGQPKNDKWAEKRISLYPGNAKDMLLYQTWIVNGVPSREEMYDRVFRFVKHCNKLNISLPWNLNDVHKADLRWSRLHKNAVPPILDLINKEKYVDECKRAEKLFLAQDTLDNDGEFEFD